jgi:hypothetical protein
MAKREFDLKRNTKMFEPLLHLTLHSFYQSAVIKAELHVQRKKPVQQANIEQFTASEGEEEVATDAPAKAHFSLEDSMRVLGFTTKPTKEEVETVL